MLDALGSPEPLVAVPAYYARQGSLEVPFLTSLLFLDPRGQIVLVDAVRRALDRVVEITGRRGLAHAIVADNANFRELVRRRVAQASVLPDCVLLFICQSAPTAERVMTNMNDAFSLSLMRAPN